MVVCRLHGGSAPQVIEAARRRINAMVPTALEQQQLLMTQSPNHSVRFAITKDVLDRAGLGAPEKVQVEGENGGPMRFILERIGESSKK